MKIISVLVVVIAFGLVLGLRPPAGEIVRRDKDVVDLPPLAPEPGALPDVHADAMSRATEGDTVGADQPGDWPDHVDALIYDYLAKHGSDIASINFVKCDKTICNVSFYASDASAATQARLRRIPTELTRPPINAGSIGYAVDVRSPGLLEVQITLYGRSVRFEL